MTDALPPSTTPTSRPTAAGATFQSPTEGPSDRTTLTAVIDAYRASGFAGDFFAEERATGTGGGSDGTADGLSAGAASSIVRCGSCASALDPRTVEMHSIRRLEGASDPADMVAVVATTCPICGTDGTLVVSYGPMASAADAEVFLAMPDLRADDVLPASVAPDEHAQADGGYPSPRT